MEKKITEALMRCQLFEGLSAEDIDFAAAAVKHRLVRFDKDDVYALAGTPCRYADIIVEGEMTARMVGPSGKFVQMATIEVGTLVAPAYIFAKDNRLPVSVETTAPTVVFRMMPAGLYQLMKGDDRVGMNFIRQLSSTSEFLARKTQMLTLSTVREKVAAFLLDEAAHHDGKTFTLTMSRQEIADTFAIQKFSLQRVIREFTDDGLIATNGKTITIVDSEGLRKIKG